MIYSTLKNDEYLEFESLLEKTKAFILLHLSKEIKTGNQFENFVFKCMQQCAQNTIFAQHIYQTADREFPDIILNNYWGVEVKFTKDDKWKSIGNSVLESSRIDAVQKIYIFFGKCGGIPDVKYRRYEECLYGISVTHYPRYEIDMELPVGNSIFDLMNIPYDELRKQDKPVKAIRQYYKSQLKDNNSLWWIDDENISPKTLEICDFKNLSLEQKEMLVAEGFVLFPEVFNSQYARLCAFWVSYYSVICPNMRDQYSAGGRKRIENLSSEDDIVIFEKIGITEIPQIYYRFLFQYLDKVCYLLKNINLQLVSECWDIEIKSHSQLLALWKSEIDKFTPAEFQKPISKLFEEIKNILLRRADENRCIWY